MKGDRYHVLGGRLGAYRKWAKTSDRAAATAAGRQAFMTRFEREVDPDGRLPLDELVLRAAAARKAYFAELALNRYRKKPKPRKS